MYNGAGRNKKLLQGTEKAQAKGRFGLKALQGL